MGTGTVGERGARESTASKQSSVHAGPVDWGGWASGSLDSGFPAEGVHELAIKDAAGRKAIFEATEDGHRCHWGGDATGTSVYFADGPAGVHISAVSNAHDAALVGLLKAVLRHAHSAGKPVTWVPIDAVELFFKLGAAQEEGYKLAEDGKSAQPVFSHAAGTELAP